MYKIIMVNGIIVGYADDLSPLPLFILYLLLPITSCLKSKLLGLNTFRQNTALITCYY